MNDTDLKMSAKMVEMIRQKSPAERLAMGCSMYDFSKRLVTSSILKEKPHLSPSELRTELFLRFYGNDFDLAKQQKIIRHIATRSSEKSSQQIRE